MLFRSTGLGKTELTGRVADLQRLGDYLVMYVDEARGGMRNGSRDT